MASRLNVGVCFCGFVRHQWLDARSHWPSIFGADVDYDSFVVGATQHTEENATDLVDADAVCARTRRAGGFRSCSADLQPYNALAFTNATARAHCLLEHGLYGHSLWPHRLASLLWQWARCARAVRASEHATAGLRYDFIMVTRLDSAHHLHAVHHSRNASKWWQRARSHELVFERCPHGSGRAEDQFFFGSRDAMLPLEGLYDAYVGQDKADPRYTSAELVLYAFFTGRGFRGRGFPPAHPSSSSSSSSLSSSSSCVQDFVVHGGALNPGLHRTSWDLFRLIVDGQNLRLATLESMVKTHASHRTRGLRCHIWLQWVAQRMRNQTHELLGAADAGRLTVRIPSEMPPPTTAELEELPSTI